MLDTHQAEAILKFETTTEKSNFALYGFAGLGASVVALGIISIIAANWNEISSITKLVTYFLLQIGLGISYLKVSASRSLLKEILLYLFSLGFFGGIGLIAQIFQLSGVFWKPFAFWLVLNIGTVFIAERRLLVHLWWLTFFITLPQALLDIWTFNLFAKWNLACISISFLVVALGLRGGQFLEKLPHNLVDLALKYGFCALLFFASIGGTELWFASRAVSVDASLALETILMYLAAALAIVSSYNRSPALNVNLKKITAGMLIVVCLFNTLPIYLPQITGKVGAAIGFIMLWFLIAWGCALLPSRRLYNLATVIIMFRFIAIYLEVFGSLLATGMGLIVSGLMLLLVAFLWHHYRQVLLRWMQS